MHMGAAGREDERLPPTDTVKQLHPNSRAYAGAHLLALIVRGGQVVYEVPAKGANLVPHVRRKVGALGHVLQEAGAQMRVAASPSTNYGHHACEE